MDHEQIDVARRVRLAAGNRPVEGHRRHERPEPVAYLGQIPVEKRFQVGVSVTPMLAGGRHRTARIARTRGRYATFATGEQA